MGESIEVSVGEVNDIEARVYAHYAGDATNVSVSGTIRGPFCQTARTLPAEIAFRPLADSDLPSAEAVVPDPCTWTAELPHVYHVELQARQEGRVVAEYQGTVGLRRGAAPRKSFNE